jgi:ATP-dependent phosphoenolpyruvate carboxykinase
MRSASMQPAAHSSISSLDRWNQDGNGSPNYEMDERTFLLNRERAVDYLNMLDRLYVFDGYAGWDPEVRVACSAALR